MVKYCVVPGLITSKTDGQEHYISADVLIRLYGLDPRQTKVIARDGIPPRPLPGEVFLYPQYDGNYALPTGDDQGGQR